MCAILFKTISLKIALCAINLLILGGGICLVLGGGFLLSSYDKYRHLVMLDSGSILFLPIGLMVLGSGFIIVSIAGCGGVFFESPTVMFVYSCLQMIFLLFEIAVSIGAVLYSDTLTTKLGNGLDISLQLYSANSRVQWSWNDIQQELECCGVKSYKDYGHNLPDTCCQHVYEGCSKPKLEVGQTLPMFISEKPSYLHTEGCLNKISKSQKLVYGHYGLGITANSLFFGILISNILANRFRREG